MKVQPTLLVPKPRVEQPVGMEAIQTPQQPPSPSGVPPGAHPSGKPVGPADQVVTKGSIGKLEGGTLMNRVAGSEDEADWHPTTSRAASGDGRNRDTAAAAGPTWSHPGSSPLVHTIQPSRPGRHHREHKGISRGHTSEQGSR